MPDTEIAASMYQPRPARDRLTIRRACYGEFAVQQEGDGRSVYLTRWGVIRLALTLLRSAAPPHSARSGERMSDEEELTRVVVSTHHPNRYLLINRHDGTRWEIRDASWKRARPDCGGCRGEGAHRKHCPRSPTYNRWLELADRAEDLGDQIGPNDMGAANAAWALAGRLRERAQES